MIMTLQNKITLNLLDAISLEAFSTRLSCCNQIYFHNILENNSRKKNKLDYKAKSYCQNSAHDIKKVIFLSISKQDDIHYRLIYQKSKLMSFLVFTLLKALLTQKSMKKLQRPTFTIHSQTSKELPDGLQKISALVFQMKQF